MHTLAESLESMLLSCSDGESQVRGFPLVCERHRHTLTIEVFRSGNEYKISIEHQDAEIFSMTIGVFELADWSEIGKGVAGVILDNVLRVLA